MLLLRGWSHKLIGVGCIAAMLTFAAYADSAATSTQSAKKSASTHAKPAAHKTSHKRKTSASRRRRSSASWRRSQQQIKPDRAQEIQEALIREHYMKGEPSGVWDKTTQSALQRYQADHGWQTKTVPDSRALIGLGLGPDHDHLLNPESAMTSGPAPKNNPPVSEAKKPIAGNPTTSPMQTSPAVQTTPAAAEPPADNTQPASVQQ